MNCRVVWQSVWLLTGSKGSALHVGQRTLPWHQERRAEPQCASPARAAQSVGRYGEQYGHRRAHNCPSVIGGPGTLTSGDREWWLKSRSPARATAATLFCLLRNRKARTKYLDKTLLDKNTSHKKASSKRAQNSTLKPRGRVRWTWSS